MSTKGVAIVTGAGQGIGRAIALRLADDGFDVAVNDIELGNLGSLVEEIEAKGRQSSFHVADVSVEKQVEQMVADVVREHGRLNVMVANAGIAKWKSFLETSMEDWDSLFAVNAKGAFLCYKYAARQMIAQGRGGRIIGASSLSGKKGSANLAAYCGTKFAVRAFTQAAAIEFGPHGITVNAYAPGAIETPLLEALDAEHALGNGGNSGDFREMLMKRTAVGYNGIPTDVANLVSFLASKESHFITGQTISCNGGVFFD